MSNKGPKVEGPVGVTGPEGVLGYDLPEELKAVEIQDLSLLEKSELVGLLKQAKQAEILAKEQMDQKDRAYRDVVDVVNRQSEEVDKFRQHADNVIRGMSEHYERRIRAIYTIIDATRDLITPPNYGEEKGE